MNINVPDSAWATFFDSPPAGAMEFWGFRFPPKAKVGDTITFHYHKVPVATAVIEAIGRPGQDQCDHSGRFKNLWKVYWKNESFVELTTPQALALRME
jgi:hypothetical protein